MSVFQDRLDTQVAIVTHHQMAEVSQPCIGSFDLPAFAIAPELATILSRLADSIHLVGNDQVDAPFLQSAP